MIMGSDTLMREGYIFVNDSIIPLKATNQWTWSIVKLTEDSLVVNSNGRILRYYNE
jgi:hypothetical protein